MVVHRGKCKKKGFPQDDIVKRDSEYLKLRIEVFPRILLG